MNEEVNGLLEKALGMLDGQEHYAVRTIIDQALAKLREAPEPPEFTKKCRAMAEVVLEGTEKLTEEKLTKLLNSDWNGVGFILRIFGSLLEGRLAAKDALKACDIIEELQDKYDRLDLFNCKTVQKCQELQAKIAKLLNS